jgi:hypothetical protein
MIHTHTFSTSTVIYGGGRGSGLFTGNQLIINTKEISVYGIGTLSIMIFIYQMIYNLREGRRQCMKSLRRMG